MTPTLTRLLRHLRRLSAAPDQGSDAELLGRFVRFHDEAAFADLVARHGPMVLNVCRRVLGNLHTSEDAFQATFLVLARRAGAVGRPESLAGWLYGVASRVARKARCAGRRHQVHPQLTASSDPPDPRPDPLAELTARDLLLVLQEEVQRLPEVYRLPVALCCLEGLSQEEAARRLGWTAGSVKGRLERGRARLHVRLARRGLLLSAALAAVEASRDASAAAVPASLLGPTVKAATGVVMGQVAAPGLIRAEVVALMEGVLKTMLRTRLTVALVALLALGLLGTATGLLAFRAGAQEQAARTESARKAAPPQGEDAPVARQAADPDVYALLLVEEREPLLLPDARRPAPGDGSKSGVYRRTQLVLLKSRSVLRAALGMPEVAGLAVVKQKADPLAWLEKNLVAAFLDNTGVLRVSVGEGGAEERAALANAVAQAYLELAVNEEQGPGNNVCGN